MGDRASGPPVAGVQVCLLGSFRILKNTRAVAVRPGGKVEKLVGVLAMHAEGGLVRDELIDCVWPDTESSLAGQSLNSLIYSLHRSLSDALSGHSPVVRESGRYRLNIDGGVRIDVREFDDAVDMGDRRLRAGAAADAEFAYGSALELYAGDLAIGSGIEHVIERERLRARYLSVYARLADLHFAAGDYEQTLANALRLLAYDPCREDAHRAAMRCYVRLGQRAQAMRQYRICAEVLALEYDAHPEELTEDLYLLIRTAPGRV
jgi:DNA-binding SARP family transcriptional activator